MPSLDDADDKALKQEGGELPEIIQQAISYCWSNGFLDIFRSYFRDNAEPFIGYPPKREMENAEHSLVHYELYQKYLVLYEDTLNDWLSKQNVSNADFYRDVKRVQDTSTDPKVQEFIYCLLASCDYDSFYSVMVREAMKLNKAGAQKAPPPYVAEAKTDAGDDDFAKGGDDDGGKGEK